MKYLLLPILFFFSQSMNSQIHWGFRLGNSMSNFENNIISSNFFSPKSEIQYLIGFDILIFVNYKFNTALSLQSEFHFLNKGGEIIHSTPTLTSDDGVSTYFKLEFIEVPFLLKYSIPDHQSFVPFGGVSFGLPISRKTSGNSYCLELEKYSTCYRTNNSKSGWYEKGKLDVSSVLGLSYEKIFLSKKFIFDIRYLYDLTDGIQNKNIEQPVFRNRNWLFTLGIEF